MLETRDADKRLGFNLNRRDEFCAGNKDGQSEFEWLQLFFKCTMLDQFKPLTI